MSPTRASRADEVIEKVVAIVAEKLPRDDQARVTEFVRQYYSGTATEELVEQDPLNLYGAAMAHWNFAWHRTPGTAKVRVYNPNFEQHGWQSTHTVIEIVNDDMPFLVDSVRMAINGRGLTTHLIIHPVMRLRRDESGHIAEVLEPRAPDAGGQLEAVMHCEVDRQTEKDALEGLHAGLERALTDVRAAVTDWRGMRERLEEIFAELEQTPPPVSAEELEECIEFLRWIEANHFTFLGYREYELREEDGHDTLCSVGGSGLGILRDSGETRVSKSFSALPPEVRRIAHEPHLLVITKANSRATVHRPGYLDYVGVKRIDANGRVTGERRFLGLYTSAAYHRVPRDIPLLRLKAQKTIDRAEYPPNSHAAKSLQHILDTFPRDLLFQLPDNELYETALGILHLEERQRIRLFMHRDLYRRFYFCILYVPRERYNTEIRLRLQGILEAALHGEDTEFNVDLSQSVLARLYFVIHVPVGSTPESDVPELEARLIEATRSWTDDLAAALLEHCGEERGTRLFRRFGNAFPAGYRERYTPPTAVYDVERMEDIEEVGGVAMSLYKPLEAPPGVLQFKLFRAGDPIVLSDALPMLENMGLRVIDERPARIVPARGGHIWIHDFGLQHREGEDLDLDEIRDAFQQAFAEVWRGAVENDGFNRLVLHAELEWREIVVLRAVCKYLRQLGVTFSQEYMERTLTNNQPIARLLVALFHARFDPARARERAGAVETLVSEIETALDQVANLDEDRILRSFLGVIQAMTRTNYYQHDGEEPPKPYLSFKVDPSVVPGMPEPRPMFEIFVYSPRVEGVHLRGGKVARGGLRWSDRREDFRTEVLGLVKAQMVKNAVIVPVGSKGGFVPKQLPVGGDREAILNEGVECYKTFVRGLLDLTDNLVAGKLVPPSNVARHDEDDPYLVVAADKGTATFSDIANGVANDYGFWLGDAFASGGSMGYDHKKMGITARGAWESVKRHFRELGTNIQEDDFTVTGIGDMSGDVFGNGMLLSRHIKLIGAFNHLHIFLDPDPDPETSFAERERLFKLPRSSWSDYDTKLISKGGGVWPRSAKSIALAPEVRKALGVEAASLTPNELVRAMLKAPVDLLWNGGIGTYVKARSETHADVGDRTNDAVRVDAPELRCRVVGEGGNLGLTQRGRIEFALHGGRVHTDAIDNSGGVDCSDHEVNIKILLNAVVHAGDMTEKQRNNLLAEMTEEVAAHVLRNNYLQTQALSLAAHQSASMLDVHARLMRRLERDGKLSREIEFLPSNEEITERMTAGKGLVSPELAVLLAYTKINLYQSLLDSDLPDDPYLVRELESYFPRPLRENFRAQMRQHRLAREIISTVVINDMVNRQGITFAFRLGEETGAVPPEIARAYAAAREIFDMKSLWGEIEALDTRIPAHAQITMLLEGRKLVERAARWLLRNRPQPLHIAENIEHFAPGVATLARELPELVVSSNREKLTAEAAKLTEVGVPQELAARVSGFNELFSALDIVEVAEATAIDVEKSASVYFNLGSRLELHWLRDQITALPRENRWQALARAALRDDLYSQQSTLTADVLNVKSEKGEAEELIDAWMLRNGTAAARSRQILGDLKSAGNPDFTMLSVAMREIRALRMVAGSTAPVASAGRKEVPERRARRTRKVS